MLNDNFLLFKENLKSKLSQNPIARRNHPAIGLAQRIVRKVGAEKIEKIIDGKPSSYLVVTERMIIRIPLDDLTMNRYRVNKNMLKSLAQTKIADFVPRFKEEGNIDGYVYFCEERLKGSAIDVPLSKMDEMVEKAVKFITSFHQETLAQISLDRNNFKRLIARNFNELTDYLPTAYKEKLEKIEAGVEKQLMGKTFVTVWQHGDYKIENILFNTSDWQIKGVIDWDLSHKEGLPLLDIFYLLLYKASLETHEGISKIFRSRFLLLVFSDLENKIITDYLKTLKLPRDCTKSMLIIFWLQHIAERYQDRLINKKVTQKEWFRENIYNVIDAILSD